MKLKRSENRDWAPFMGRAIELAKTAEAHGDVPIGAVVIDMDGHIIGEACNERELQNDPTAHAEVLALSRAAKKTGSWRLTGATLVVTLEPCVMCAGASVLSRVDRVVYGAKDAKAGAMGSLYQVHDDKRLNHICELVGGVQEELCRNLLVDFFRAKRG